MRGGSRVIIEPHRHEGVFIARGKEDALVTKNLVPGETVYGEKKISIEVCRLNVSTTVHTYCDCWRSSSKPACTNVMTSL